MVQLKITFSMTMEWNPENEAHPLIPVIWLLTMLDSDKPEGDHSSPPDIPDIDTS